MRLKEGLLSKGSYDKLGKWKERWFELRRNVLLYYKTKDKNTMPCVIPLQGMLHHQTKRFIFL